MEDTRLDWKSPTSKMLLGVIFAAVTFFSSRAVSPLAELMGLNIYVTSFAVRSALGIGFIVALGGKDWLRFDRKAIEDTWHFTRPLVMINIIFVAIGLVALGIELYSGTTIAPGLGGRIALVTLICILVGINEEATFRGLLFGGLLAGIGQRKNGPLMAAIISSACFGFAHVIFDLDFSNGLSIAQGLLKTLECAEFGFILSLSVLETRDLCGAMSVHAFFDWTIMIMNAFGNTEINTNYVSTDPKKAITIIVVYVVLSVLYAPQAVKAYKRLKAVPLPQYGPFCEERSAAIASTAWDDEKAYQARRQAGDVDASIGKLRDHKLYNNKYLTPIASFVSLTLLTNIVGIVPMIFIKDNTTQLLVSSVITIVVALVMGLRFQQRFADTFDGLFGWATASLLLSLPALLTAVGHVVEWYSATTFNNPLIVLVLALAPGISEEVIFRAIPGSNWMRLGSDMKNILSCIAVTALIFGGAHAINLLAGAALSSTLFQVFYAACIGVMFQAVYLRTGSMWGPIIMHTIVDATAFIIMDMNNLTLSSELTIDPMFWFNIVTSVIYLAWGLYLVRPQKQVEIADLWNRKWHKN